MKQTIRWIKILATTAFVSAAGSAFAQASSTPGVTRLDPPQPVENDGKIEVLEFYAYGCIHCANLEPQLEAWKKTLPPDVKFRAIPSGQLMGVDDAPLFYTLEAMGQLERVHKKIFEALHNERVMLGHKPTMMKWLEKNGVDPVKYADVEKSFTVQTRAQRARAMYGQYKIGSTPTLVVQGRFQVVGTPGGPPILTTVDRLIAEIRQQNARTTPAGTPASAPAKAATPTKAAPPVKKPPVKAEAPTTK
jgi:protein dithiol oxidoreductase (disulfide-forming)